MKTREWRFIDKSAWSLRGPWDDELDKKQWLDEQTGLPCLIVRGRHGGLCGYVGVPHNHTLYGIEYDDLDINVHGGLTFAAKCAPEDKEHAICHIVEPSEDDDVWWFGFDCAHSGDLNPAYAGKYGTVSDYETYKPVAYVEDQVALLAKQLCE